LRFNVNISVTLFDTLQLVRQIALRRVFLDYTEGEVKFNPTYKYDPGTDNWDSRLTLTLTLSLLTHLWLDSRIAE